MIYVCDAIMGSGKSSAAIAYMNSHPDRRFIYITPYLEEAKRIKEHCPALNFVEPEAGIREYGGSKGGHAAALICRGDNIASTHQALMNYTDAMLENIHKQEYELIVDESINLLNSMAIKSDDREILLKLGLVEVRNGRLVCTDSTKEYDGVFTPLLRKIRQTELYITPAMDMIHWMLPPELITSFSNVYILTYLFKGQGIYQYFQINHLEYEMIGVRIRDGTYEFCECPGDVPAYTKRLKDRIHICMDAQLNDIGQERTALSATKYKTGKVDLDRLRLNLRKFFRDIHHDKPAKQRMWSAFKGSDVGRLKKDYVGQISDRGYKNCFVEYNARATNKYRNKTVLAYLVNVYMNLPDKQFYLSRGAEVDEDTYALSVMIQWIWRSGIREGKDIYIYIPSRRMRDMFIDWINSLNDGGDADET